MDWVHSGQTGIVAGCSMFSKAKYILASESLSKSGKIKG